jgi:hypothetical protein
MLICGIQNAIVIKRVARREEFRVNAMIRLIALFWVYTKSS